MSVGVSGANIAGSAALLAAMPGAMGSRMPSCEGGAAFVSSPDCVATIAPAGGQRGMNALFASAPAGMMCAGGPGRKGTAKGDAGGQLGFALLDPGAASGRKGVADEAWQPDVTAEDIQHCTPGLQDQVRFHSELPGRVQQLVRVILVRSLASASGTVFGAEDRLTSEIVPELCTILNQHPKLGVVVADTMLGQCTRAADVGEGVLIATLFAMELAETDAVISFFDTLLQRAALGKRGNSAAALLVMLRQVDYGFFKKHYATHVVESAKRALYHKNPTVKRFAQRILKGEVMPKFVAQLLQEPWMVRYRHRGRR